MKNISICENFPVGEESQVLLFWEEAKLRGFLKCCSCLNGGNIILFFKDLKNYGHEKANRSPLFGMALAEELAGQWKWGCADLASTLRNQMHMILTPGTKQKDTLNKQKHMISKVEFSDSTLKEKHVLCNDWCRLVLMLCVLPLLWSKIMLLKKTRENSSFFLFLFLIFFESTRMLNCRDETS